MATQPRRRRRPAWQGKRRGVMSLRERRPFKTRAELEHDKSRWYLKRDKVFFWSGEWRELTFTARAVLEVLTQLGDGDNPYRWLYASDRDIMHLANMSRRAVRDAFCNLQEHGCIEGERGGRRPGRYRLTDKVQSFAHGPRKQPTPDQATPATPPPATDPRPAGTATPVDDEILDVPETLAAVVSPFQWKRLLKDNSPDQIRHAVMAYSSEAAARPIEKPLALFCYLLRQDRTAARAIELQAAERQAAAVEERDRQKRADAQLERERSDAMDARRNRPFTDAEIAAYSKIVLAKLHNNDFARKNIKIGGASWTNTMWGFIEAAADAALQATPPPPDSPGTTQSDSTANGPDVAAEAGHSTRGGDEL